MGFFDFLKSKTIDVWKDNNTGLLWQLDIPLELMTWDEANLYVININNSSYGGFKDWRLPTIEELEWIYRYENLDIAWKYKEKGVKTDFQHSFYWSSNELGDRIEKIMYLDDVTTNDLKNKAWNICINSAMAGYDPKFDKQCVRLVRG